jgi:hypothetical protein
MKVSTSRVRSCFGLLAGVALCLHSQPAKAQAFVHPGLLHRQEDFDRMKAKVNAGAQPWKSGWDVLVANGHSQLTYTPAPVVTLIRGTTSAGSENYSRAMNDAAAAYQTALRWKISGDSAYANKSIQILNAWASTCTGIDGDSNQSLAAGLYGYQFANAAEIMRTYSGWSVTDFTKFKDFMVNVFYAKNNDFLVRHHGTCDTHYWANWDLCNMASVMAIGVLCDDRTKYNQALDYFKNGLGNGNINRAVYYLHSATMGQGQESGRDQGHATLNVSLLGVICEQAWNQGDDLYAYGSKRVLAGCEYTASYNLGNTVPYTTYSNCDGVTQTVISDVGRGNVRPAWELIYNHYTMRMGLSVPYSAQWASQVRPEGGGGNYGTTSGGFDQLGFGTLTCTLDAAPLPNGTYRIVNRKSGKVMDVSGASTADKANVQQWTSNGGTNQQWTLTSLGNGQYKIIGVGSGKSLDISGNSTADGANAQIYPYNGGNNQRYTLIYTTGGYYRITPVHSGKCVEVAGGSTADGGNVQQWTYNGGTNQQWSFQTVSAAAASSTKVAARATARRGNG